MTHEPRYRHLHASGELARRVTMAQDRLADCTMCPRQCHANRLEAAGGHCRTGRHAIVSACHPHHGEEAPISGRLGSGTIFFASCSLGCVFCQNWRTSHMADGVPVSDRRLGEMMLELQARGCHNINLVTPTHVVPQLLGALAHAVEGGLSVPVVYNTGGYDLPESLALLDGVVDIYMPDVKTLDANASERWFVAPDYPERARAAVREMHRQVGDLTLDEEGIAVRGLLVRHLLMPAGAATTGDVMQFLAAEVSPATYVNLMDQYHPCGAAARHPEIDCPITAREFDDALASCRAAGIHRLDRGVGARFRRLPPQ